METQIVNFNQWTGYTGQIVNQTNLYKLLNQLNQTVKAYPNVILSPLYKVCDRQSSVMIMDTIYLKAHLSGLNTPQVQFLHKILLELQPHRQKYDMHDLYLVINDPITEAAYASVKAILRKAHIEAPVV